MPSPTPEVPPPVKKTLFQEFKAQFRASGLCTKIAFVVSATLSVLNGLASGSAAIALIFIASSVGAYFTIVGPLILLTLVLFAVLIVSLYKITMANPSTTNSIPN
ncbi:hypothetical protein [Candidatus Chlamydia corallus]|uniref:hypothetical protein n=1 Tax=Candidatus Chlamydia corallus TaxID=2038470 RepID=UPI000C2FBF4B|nr:hypothetical protein [Candidatus Chlamydia corallus]